MEEKDYIDRLFDSIEDKKLEKHDLDDDYVDELSDMQIDFADKYLPDDKEGTKRRIQAECSLCMLIIANRREAFRDGFNTAKKLYKAEWNKRNNEVNNDLDYNLDDIRFELSQVCSVLHYITNAAFEITPATVETNNISNSLRLITDTLSRTHNRLEILLGFFVS